MTILLELDPEMVARLKALADREEISPEQYASEFLRDVLPLYAPGSGKLTRSDLQRFSVRFSAGSENLPILPPEAFERESFYEDDRIKYSWKMLWAVIPIARTSSCVSSRCDSVLSIETFPPFSYCACESIPFPSNLQVC